MTLTHERPTWQVSLVREPGGRLQTRLVRERAGRFVLAVRDRPAGGDLRATPMLERPDRVEDPSRHPTFRVPADSFRGETIRSDLHYAEVDAARPRPDQRIVVSFLRAVTNDAGGVAAVLRASLRAEQVDALTRIRVDENAAADPHRIFVCDGQGRLITRLQPGDALREMGDDLRASPDHLPPEMAQALAHPAVTRVSDERPLEAGALESGGRRFLLTLRALEGTQGWRVGVLVPEDHYTRGLSRTRDRLLAASAVIMLLIVAGAGLALRAVRRGLRQVERTTARMRDFDFAPEKVDTPFHDVREVMGGLERAKTAMRALGKYVPVDLVRLLYASGREPAPGGELRDLTMMFTDIKDFTGLAEGLSPDELARRLGLYLAAMTGAVHEARGTVDKYIGDAVMALWNAPTPVPDHAAWACRAALACRRATALLFASEQWVGPPLTTRFGLHRDTVMVGHFGAPDRLSYTALGDGVNVASRLEGLNKQYGTTIVVSESVREAAGPGFLFRTLDVVAVKGRQGGLRIHELLGTTDEHVSLAAVTAYELAFAAYQARRFDRALELMAAVDGDGPCEALRARCRRFLADPPPADWDGVATFTTK